MGAKPLLRPHNPRRLAQTPAWIPTLHPTPPAHPHPRRIPLPALHNLRSRLGDSRAGDHYQDLSLPFSATEREIKSRFRRLAAIHHPDKVSSSTPSSEGYFIHLKLAQDTLLNPAKRFAYERFGPGIADWQHCSSIRDYIMHGIQSILPYYGGAAVFMYILGIFGYLTWGKYWRWLTLIILCVFELHTISRPFPPFIAAKVLNPILATFTSHPPYLPFQIIQLARKTSVTLYIAFSQIGPLLQPPTASATSNSNAETALKQQLDRLEATVKAADVKPRD